MGRLAGGLVHEGQQAGGEFGHVGDRHDHHHHHTNTATLWYLLLRSEQEARPVATPETEAQEAQATSIPRSELACKVSTLRRSPAWWGRGGLAVRLLVYHPGEPSSIPGGVAEAPGFSHVGIVPDDAAGRRVSSGISLSPPPLQSNTAPYSLGSQDLAVKSPQTSSLTPLAFGARQRESAGPGSPLALHRSLASPTLVGETSGAATWLCRKALV
ncbi:hypothetical protein PR048_026417 [Dryococelus australis]|uniref:Uncharacterized protein n=1 Tax=Dryococelus australis TaxID=614101 RepID=A0ABQ9GL96_9NEOP|nr:hypothetical protein PR048_026417 [Dryococelus australis]